YTFKHGLIRQVAYGTVLEVRRTALHAKLVEQLECLYADRLLEQIELLAHHSVHGKVWDKAMQYLHDAGKKAAARSAYRQAVAYLEHAVAVSRNVTATTAVREWGVDIRFDLRNALLALGEYSRIIDCLREAE